MVVIESQFMHTRTEPKKATANGREWTRRKAESWPAQSEMLSTDDRGGMFAGGPEQVYGEQEDEWK